MSETVATPVELEAFDWNAVGKKGEGYSKEEREQLEAVYEKTLKSVAANEIIDGTVVAKNNKEVVVNIGYKSDGVVQLTEFRYNPDLKVGDTVEVYVESQEDKSGQLILSHKTARAMKSWERVNQALANDEIIKGYVKCRTKGGLIADVFGIEAFLPGSQIDVKPIRDYDIYVGKTMEFKVVKINNEFKNVVVSHKALIEAELEQQKKEIISKLEKGQVLEGTVKNITSYGVFIDLGGVDGLVHVSELSWKHIDHPSEVVEVGQEVTVEVLDVDFDRERVSLSLKATQEDPWQAFARTHAIGQVVPGKVTKLVPFGAFVRVEDGIEGLVHISELAVRHVEIPEQVVQVGDDVFVKVIDIDLERRRISLSLKQANEGFDPTSDDFDPALYGMAAEYDEAGNYKYPEGFDPATNEWLEGYEAQREVWEAQYAKAHERWEAHRKQVAEAAKADAEAASGDGGGAVATASSYSSAPAEEATGTLASDEALAALREKLTGN